VSRLVPFAIALLLDLIGAGGALLLSVRHWQTITTPRPAPLHDDVLAVSGRTIDAAPTALALVALAGVVAVLATRGVARRVVGAVLGLAGLAMIWRALAGLGAVSTSRARSLLTAHLATVDAAAVVPKIDLHSQWPALTVVCGVLIAGAGVLVASRGHKWRGLSARYARPGDQPHGATATTMWTALDRGEDPT
jgi:uncharacterized membrane protein (TIGR02234 family)